jgi:MFS family permease
MSSFLPEEALKMSKLSLPTSVPENANLPEIIRIFSFILFGVLAFGLATGGLFPIIGLRLQEDGASDLVIGLITSVFFAGTFAGSILTERILARIRHIRTFSLLAATAGMSTIALALTDLPAAWIALRFVTGFCLGGYYVVVESWINYSSTNKTRARGMSVYEATRMLGIAISPFVLGFGLGGQPYILAGLLFILAIIPLVLCPLDEPHQNPPGTLPFSKLILGAPLGVLACFVSGTVNAAFYGMSGVYGERAGLSTTEIAIFIAAMLIGPTFAHPILGGAADRIGRLPMLFLASAVSAMAAIWIAVAGPGFMGLIVFSFILGGFSHPVYSIGVAYVNDKLDPGDFVRAGGALLIAFCLGTTVGPTAAALTMSVLGDAGLYVFLAAILISVAVGSALAVARTKTGRVVRA